MKRSKRLLKILTLQQLRNFIGSSAVARRFAERHDLVYFGSVGRDDESRLVRGVTVSSSHQDSHYLVGTAYGRDVIFLQRSDTVRSSNHKKLESYTWNILALDLKQFMQLPHMYIEGRSRHGRGFYEALAMTKREFGELPLNFLSSYDPLFAERFVVRLAAASANEFPTLLTPERAAVLAHHFAAFDFEWHDDLLYVYYLSARPSLAQLDLMLKAGVWLADELEASSLLSTPTASEVEQ